MRSELCMTRQCKTCKNEIYCFHVCEHNYVLKKKYPKRILYQCTKCDVKLKLRYDDICVECIKTCKGKFKSTFDERTGKAKLCSGFKSNSENV
jgi:hypothetical protein